MKNILIFSLLLVISSMQCTMKMKNQIPKNNDDANLINWRQNAPEAGKARAIQLGDYQSFDLENGLKVILVENHKRPTVSFQLSLNHDQINQGDKIGFVSMAGDLLNKGTNKRNKSEIDNAIDFIGATLKTHSTGVFANSLKKHSNELLGIMSEIVLEASFPKAEFDKSKKQAISGLTMSLSNADAMMSNLSDVTIYGESHPYGEIQTVETTENIDIETCKDYYNTYFRPNNAYLVIVGDMTIEESKSIANKYFSNWEKGDIPNFKYEMPKQPKGNKVSITHKDGSVQSSISIAYPISLNPGSDDIIKTRVMNAILGGGIFSGRLMQNLREDKAYTYGARSRLVADPLVGYFNAYAKVRNEVTDSSVTEILFEMDRMVKEKITEKDLQLVKNSMTGGFARSLESPQTIARFASNTFRYNLPKDYYKNYLMNLSNVSVEDVYAMAQKYIKPQNANILIVGEKDVISQKLEKFDFSGEIDFYDAFGNKLEELDIDVSNVTPKEILENYINAIGGLAKIREVKTMEKKWEMQIMGQRAVVIEKWQENNKYASEMKLGEMVMEVQKFDGIRLYKNAMGNEENLTSGKDWDNAKYEAIMFKEIYQYENIDKFQFSIDGVEVISGEKTYKMSVIDEKGEKSTRFYGINSGFLKKIITSETMGKEVKTMGVEFSNYQENNEVFMPKTQTLTGLFPRPVEMNMFEHELNVSYTNDVF